MKIKKYILMLICLFLLPLSACSEEVKSGHVAVFAYTDSDNFMNALLSDIRNKFSELNYTSDVFYSSNDQSIQNQQIDKAIKDNKYDAFIVNLCDRMVGATIVKRINASKKPLVFFNRKPLEEDFVYSEKCFFVGTDAAEEANQQINIIKDIFSNDVNNIKNSKFDLNGDGKLQTLILKGEIGHQDAEIRTDKIIEGLKDFNVIYSSVEVCDWRRETAYRKVIQILEEKTNIEVIVSNNDEMAIGAIAAYKTLEKTNLPIIVGVDGTTFGKSAVDNGEMSGTVINDSVSQAKAIVDIANDILTKGMTNYNRVTYSKSRIYVK